MIKIGTVVTWSSGSIKPKTGKIIDTIPANISAKSVFTFSIEPKFSDLSPYARYLIESTEEGKLSYSAPLIAIVDKCNQALAELYQMNKERAALQAQIKKVEESVREAAQKEREQKNSKVFEDLKTLLTTNGISYSDALTFIYKEIKSEKEASEGTLVTVSGSLQGPITYNGKTNSLYAWCKELHLNYGTVYQRIRKGWTVEKAFS